MRYPQMLTKCIYDLDGLINCSTIKYFVDITEYGHCISIPLPMLINVINSAFCFLDVIIIIQ